MKKVKIEQAENGYVISLLDGSYSERPVKTWVAEREQDLFMLVSMVFRPEEKE